MELTKNDSKMIQGLSVMAMVWLHLFDREYIGLFSPLFFVGSKPLTFLVAQLADFCVLGFAFISGYGHMAQRTREHWYKQRLKGLLSVLINYWTVLCVFSIVSVVIGQASIMPGSLTIFLKNALTIENSYNGAWWYMYAYAVIVVISPLLVKIVDNWHPACVIFASGILYISAYAVRFWLPDSGLWFVTKFGPLGMTIVEYMIGAFFFRYKLLSWIYMYWNRINKYFRYFISIVLLSVLLIARTYLIPALFFAPVSGIVIIVLFHFWNKPKWLVDFFMFIGNHSTNIWLTHMFFYSVMFVDLVYVLKYPVLIFLLMMVLNICLSIILNAVEKPMKRMISIA